MDEVGKEVFNYTYSAKQQAENHDKPEGKNCTGNFKINRGAVGEIISGSFKLKR
jgi:hypothetical protein